MCFTIFLCVFPPWSWLPLKIPSFAAPAPQTPRHPWSPAPSQTGWSKYLSDTTCLWEKCHNRVGEIYRRDRTWGGNLICLSRLFTSKLRRCTKGPRWVSQTLPTSYWDWEKSYFLVQPYLISLVSAVRCVFYCFPFPPPQYLLMLQVGVNYLTQIKSLKGNAYKVKNIINIKFLLINDVLLPGHRSEIIWWGKRHVTVQRVYFT